MTTSSRGRQYTAWPVWLAMPFVFPRWGPWKLTVVPSYRYVRHIPRGPYGPRRSPPRKRIHAAMKVWIDQDLCTGDGLCEEIAPAVFTLLDDGLAHVKEGTN